MFELKSILVPVDFSERSLAAVEHAFVLARRFGARLAFLHVIPSSAYEYGVFEGGIYTEGSWPTEEEMRGSLNRLIQSVVQEQPAEVSFENVVRKGDPAKEIESEAESRNAGLIVMPTRGYGAFRRFVLGSVTTKVLHDLVCPVFTGAHVPEVPVYAENPYRRVACAVDLKEGSEKVLRWASDFANGWDAELVVIHAAPALEWEPAEGQYFTSELRESLVRAKKEETESLLDQVSATARVYVDSDDVAYFVPAAVKHAKADVLVIGRGHHERGLGRLRTHAYALIRESPCPVISI